MSSPAEFEDANPSDETVDPAPVGRVCVRPLRPVAPTLYEPAPAELVPEDPLPDDVDYVPAAAEPAGARGDDVAARAPGSLLPSVVAILAGVLVVGLLALLMLAPNSQTSAAQSITLSPGSPAQDNESSQEIPRPGYLAPDFTLTRLDGTSVKLSSYRGVKPVWVNFWATWCPPCRGEMPEMQKIYQEYQAKGVEILGVDVQEDPTTVKNFVQANGYGWNFLLDRDGAVSRTYYITGIPTHLFIGRDGIIKSLLISGMNHDMMIAELNKILGQ